MLDDLFVVTMSLGNNLYPVLKSASVSFNRTTFLRNIDLWDVQFGVVWGM